MTMPRQARWLVPFVALAGAAAALAPASASGDSVTLKAAVRVTTAGDTPCPAEGEPEVTVTSAGTWVGYNDDHECALDPRLKRIVTVQLIPAGGGAVRRVPLDGQAGQVTATEVLAGDPELMPDPKGGGGVVFTTLYSTGAGTTVEMFRISPSFQITRLPSPSKGASAGSDDKEFAAADTNPHSRYRGRLYVVWDDFASTRLVFRAYDGKRWLEPVYLAQDVGKGDVAVGPKGDIAVAWESGTGVMVAESHNGGATFTDPDQVLTGPEPGRSDPSCPLRPTVGTRQRTSKSVRVAYDGANHVHVVAALGDKSPTVPAYGAGNGGTSTIWHAAESTPGNWNAAKIVPEHVDEQWAPAIARTPQGGVAVAYLQVTDVTQTQYDAYLAVMPKGRTRFSAPVKISPAASVFASLMEAEGNSNCYGVGDYIGLAPSPNGVVAVWPTTDGSVKPEVDSDIYAREAVIK